METVLKWKYAFFFVVTVFGCRQNSDTENCRQMQAPTNLGNKTDLEIPLAEEPINLVEGSNMLVDKSGNLTSHTLVKDGRPVYLATYLNQKKISNHLLPWIQDAFLFEDKYYLKVYFPFPYRGKINIELKNDPEYVLTPVEDQKYQVVINHALDLNHVDFIFHYKPAAADTLVETTFSYSYVMMIGG